MGPTCSVFYEREPVDSGIMDRPPAVRHRVCLRVESRGWRSYRAA
ncbi:hypothetical protein ACQ86N_25485 [Puia sp. P3]